MSYRGTLGFELEINLVDHEENVVNYIDGKIASTQILRALEGNGLYQKLVAHAGGPIVKPELDASQLELLNPTPKECLEQLQYELAETFLLLDNIISRDFDLHISKQVVPPQDFEPVHSNALPRYQNIHDALMGVSTNHRKSTNITGTHLNYLAGENFEYHIPITQFVRERALANDRRSLGATSERVSHYINVVSALMDEKVGLISHGHLPHDINSSSDVRALQLDRQDNALFSYELVRLKSLGINGPKLYLSELRTVDGPTSYEDVYMKTQKAYDILTTSIAKKNNSSIQSHKPLFT